MGLYRFDTTGDPNYNRISKNIGELYQPIPSDVIKLTSSEPIFFDVDFFSLSFSDIVEENTFTVDEKNLKDRQTKFFEQHFGL